MRAAIYSRYSTDRQNESTIADQLRVCAEFASTNGMRIVDRFEDLGISGAALGNRPGVLRMREAALAKRFDVLLILDISRLSRSMADVAKLTEQLVFAGVRVVAVHDNADTARDGWEMQFGLAGLIGQHFRKMVALKTHTALKSRASAKRPTGGRAYGYRDNVIVESEAAIVGEIFARHAAGESCRAIASELNRRGIASPGSTWARVTRRASGWMGSAIRAMLRNERYMGVVNWNTSSWVKDPDTGIRKRRDRPRSEWITHRDESLRIVSNAEFDRAQRRTRGAGDPRVKSGGKTKFLLSGLLRCGECGAHYVMASARDYRCSGFVNGATCPNGVSIGRAKVEDILLSKLRADLFAPESIKTIAQDMQERFREVSQAAERQADERPRELQELDARLERLRDRLRLGDPDMTADELQAAIDRADEKRRALVDAQPYKRETAKILAMLPKAAEAARREIASALAGDSRASLKARVMLREAYSGRIDLRPEQDGGLVAHWHLNGMALLRLVGTSGSGGRI